MKFRAILPALLLALPLYARAQQLGGARPAAPDGAARVSVVSSNEEGVTVEISGLQARVMDIAGAQRVVHNAGALGSEPTDLSLPALFLTLGVPHDASDFRASVSVTGFDSSSFRLRPGGELPAASSGAPVTVGPSSTHRGLRTVILRYQPFRFAGSSILTESSARITLSWKRGRERMKQGPVVREVASVEETLRSQILNYDAARIWRQKPVPASGRTALAASSWGMERSMILRVARNAVYRAGGSELAGSGAADLIGSPVSSLRIRNRSNYIRFYVDDRAGDGIFGAEDAIEFHGVRNPSSEGLYFDAVTDTNAYILSWNGGAGSTPALAGRSGTGDAPPLAMYDSTLHFEGENIYYPGPSYPLGTRYGGWGESRTIYVSDRVENERFYWTNIAYPQQKVVEFNCSPAYANGGTFMLRVRLVGLTDDATIPYYHNTLVQLNGIDVGTVLFPGFTDTTAAFEIPASYLLNGRNRMTLVPLESPTRLTKPLLPDQVNLDYIRISGRWLPSAWDDAPTVRLAGDGAQRVSVAGLTSPVSLAVSGSSRAPVSGNDRGFLFRLASRQFEVGLRSNPGFVAQFNDTAVFSPLNGAGLMLIEADGSSGRLLRQRFLNLYDPVEPNAFAAASQFLGAVPAGNIVIAGFAVGGGQQGELPAELKSAFAALGSSRVGGNNFVSSWAFAARKGEPATAVERYATLDESNRGVTLDAFIPAPNGDRYRAIVTLEGNAGEEFQMSAPASPGLRFHAGDDLLSTGNQASMLVVTHPAFSAAANRLAEHRARHSLLTGDSLTVRVVDVERIYDEFNDGIKSPVAIRRFLQYADSNWAQPSPAYVLLFGDASWDPQRRLPSSAMIDYIPTNGIPSNDYMFTVPFNDPTLPWQQFIGRIPATTAADADGVVDKIVEYDTLPPAAWNKRFAFMAGGSSRQQVNDHRERDRGYASYVMSPSFQGDTVTIWRTTKDEDLPMPDAKDADWARAEINKGALWVSFSGHGATDVADLDYGYPEQFDNGNRYFVLATFSCQTGAFAEPQATVRNERFLMYPGKGAIASIAGTSYSFPYLDQYHKEWLYRQITQKPHQRILGAIFTRAKFEGYFRDVAVGWEMSREGYDRRNSLLMYNFLGDPSMPLAVRSTVELAFSDVAARNSRGEEPVPGDSLVNLSARIWNYGIPADSSVTVVASITDKAQVTSYDTVTVAGLGHHADLQFQLPLIAEAGEYIVRLQADPERMQPESFLRDNDTSFTLRVRGNQPLPIEPVPFGRVAGYDDVVIRLLNPPVGPGADIEVDTSETFSTAFTNRSVGTMQLEELTTTWTFSIPAGMRSARKFWWRAVSTAGNPDVSQLFPITESFTVDAAPAAEFIVGGAGQIARGRITNLVNTASGIGPGERRMPIMVMGMGQSKYSNGQDIPRSFVRVMVDGRDYNRPALDGINILLLDRASSRVIAKGTFAFYAQASSKDVDRFLAMADTIRPEHLVLLWVNGKSLDMDYRGDEIRAALRSLGSNHADLLEPEDSYVLIGGKGLAPGAARDSLVRAAPLRSQGIEPPYYVSIADTVSLAAGEGSYVSPQVGPATAWRRATFSHAGGSQLGVTVFGVRRDGMRDSLLSISGTQDADLSGVDVKTYPRLEFRAQFPSDSTLRLRDIRVDYDPSPELAIVPSTLRMEPDSVLQGDPSAMTATVVNLSRRYAAENITVRLDLNAENVRPPFDTLHIGRLAPLDSVRHSYAIATAGLKDYNAFTLRVNGSDIPAEPYQQNNSIGAALLVGVDVIPPGWAVYADDNRLIDGDYVNPQPRFEIRLYDNSSLAFGDSIAVEKLIIDNELIVPHDPGTEFKVMSSGEHRISFYYTPQIPLEDGEHELWAYLKDASGNPDTIRAVIFYVERDLKIRNVVNWPNPLVDRTTFTFMVSGGTTPKSGEIGIYTVAGRKIKTIKLGPTELQLGFNRVEWDGLDEDRDRLANGVYLYKILIDNGETTQEVIEKIVVMR